MGGLVVATCKACNWNGELDNRHKLATYIAKNPPSSGIGFDEDKKDKKSKEDRQRSEQQSRRNSKTMGMMTPIQTNLITRRSIKKTSQRRRRKIWTRMGLRTKRKKREKRSRENSRRRRSRTRMKM